jgi:uroporphyrinogen decarboxylase
MPDFNHYLEIFNGKNRNGHIPMVEFYTSPPFQATFLDEKYIPPDKGSLNDHWKQQARFFGKAGFDFVPIEMDYSSIGFIKKITETHQSKDCTYTWVDESKGYITSLEEFETYPWPELSSIDYTVVDLVHENLIEGMKSVICIDGIFEITRELMGFETFSFALYENSDLVKIVSERIGNILLNVHKNVVDYEKCGSVHIGDDMCGNNGPLISPDIYRNYFFPWHKKYVENAHSKNKPVTFHSDGDCTLIMDDLIDNIGFDGKHAYQENAGGGVRAFSKKYGSRITILGGIDMDYLIRNTSDQIYTYTKNVVEACLENGGYALGTGNSITPDIPIENYKAMLKARGDIIG